VSNQRKTYGLFIKQEGESVKKEVKSQENPKAEAGKSPGTVGVYGMDDCTWYAGEGVLAVMSALVKDTGITMDEYYSETLGAEPHRLTDEEMDHMLYYIDDDRSGPSRSFRGELDHMIAEGVEFPCFFATTEF